MNLEAVTVCIGYADFLAQAVPYNRPLFARWIVATSPDDHATREVCRRYNLQTILTNDHTHGGEFAKGRVVERALQHLSADGWRMHLDADIVLPRNTRHMLDIAGLQEDCIYGADRVMVKSWEQWQAVRASGYLDDQHDYHCRIRFPAGIELGTRWAHPVQGWCPIGWMQLWHSSQDEWNGVRVKPYPLHHGNACRTDVQHSLQWDRAKRVLLPEIIAVHLESEACAKGTNWNGRKTKPFGPAVSPESSTPTGS